MDVRNVNFITALFILVQPNRMSCQFHVVINKNVFFFTQLFFLKINLLYLFIFGCVGSFAARGLSLVAASGVYSLLRCAGFTLRWPLVAARGLQ